MLTTKLIASLLVLGTTATTALAAPCNDQPAPQPTTSETVVIQAPVAYAPPTTTTIVAPRPIWHGPALPVFPQKIATDVRFNANGYKIIPVGVQAGAFHKLIVQSDNGRTKIAKIEVVFGNHQTETFREDQLLKNNATLTVDFAGKRNIEKVVVFGSDKAYSGFTVVAA